jgi:hypothetical protein
VKDIKAFAECDFFGFVLIAGSIKKYMKKKIFAILSKAADFFLSEILPRQRFRMK